LEAIRQMKLCSVGGARGCLGLINWIFMTWKKSNKILW
jgi:hypothetical protein